MHGKKTNNGTYIKRSFQQIYIHVNRSVHSKDIVKWKNCLYKIPRKISLEIYLKTSRTICEKIATVLKSHSNIFVPNFKAVGRCYKLIIDPVPVVTLVLSIYLFTTKYKLGERMQGLHKIEPSNVTWKYWFDIVKKILISSVFCNSFHV